MNKLNGLIVENSLVLKKGKVSNLASFQDRERSVIEPTLFSNFEIADNYSYNKINSNNIRFLLKFPFIYEEFTSLSFVFSAMLPGF